MAEKDYYYILGVSPEASIDQIQRAYQELYDKFGPHVTVKEQDPEAMAKAYKDICEAWEVLSDPVRKKEYDKTNLPLLQKSHLRSLWGKLTGVQTEDVKSKEDAPETRMTLEITLREAVKGAKKSIRVEENLPCQGCQSKKPVDRLKCLNCHGVGSIRSIRNEEIEVPPGIYDEQILRYPGKGKYDARMHKYGELAIDVKIESHPVFSTQGKDIVCTVPVNIYEAILGADIEAPTPTGKVVMKIQPLTQRGRVYRLKGLGLGGGDLLVTIDVTTPSQISADEVILFRKLKEVSTLPNPRLELFAKIAQMQNPNQS